MSVSERTGDGSGEPYYRRSTKADAVDSDRALPSSLVLALVSITLALVIRDDALADHCHANAKQLRSQFVGANKRL